MNNDLNFLKNLQNHEVKPPAMLFDAVKQRIAAANDSALDTKLKELSNFTKAPPANLEFVIKAHLANKKLIFIKGNVDAVLQPIAPKPSSVQTAVIKMLSVKSSDKEVITMSNFKKYAVPVAASLLFAFSTLIYNINPPAAGVYNDDSFVINLPDNKENAVADNNLLAVVDKPKEAIKEIRAPKVKNIVKVADKESMVSNELLTETMLVVNGIELKFVDNDFFATFASFNTVTTDFLNNIPEGKDQTVRLNNYSSIVITAKMQAMMKKMYKTKRNGKIPNSAKKLQKKLLDWKQSDNKYFDSNNKNNPLDPIDLFDFLLVN